MKNLSLFKTELRRTFLNDSINSFYLFSMILWPIVSFIQLSYNYQLFPIESLKITGIHSQKELLYFVFIGYCALTFFQNIVQSAWRLGYERQQGTLSQIFMTPVNKLKWLYSRTSAMLLGNAWFFLLLFIFGNLWYTGLSIKGLLTVLLSAVLISTGGLIWGAFIVSFFVILRDGTILYVFLEGPQEAFSGVKVPLTISPVIVRFIGSIFPLSYTILLLRNLLITGQSIITESMYFLGINLFLVLVTTVTLKYGELYMRKTGNFDLY
ncbi:hypothetical protein [Candidatus Enterococcus clewellii]|uniref:Transport permease protein n=1 Tax=Candidatus Enterococcus clewellii TaxID=1834193 RepID=A0A242K3H3_9ENTE|nr:hypothetical protein [Enterococcus sp. 9E7_DIV0242]OTP11586.1 hypothetical protein A5888_003685 [Enterococcus sp. 9E7_DIV0242]